MNPTNCDCDVCKPKEVKKPEGPDVLVRFKEFFQALIWQDQRDLYYYLCALRGPDNGDWSLKQKTTAIIRSFLMNSETRSDLGCDVVYKSSVPNSHEYEYVEGHFASHVWLALTQLEKSKITREQ